MRIKKRSKRSKYDWKTLTTLVCTCEKCKVAGDVANDVIWSQDWYPALWLAATTSLLLLPYLTLLVNRETAGKTGNLSVSSQSNLQAYGYSKNNTFTIQYNHLLKPQNKKKYNSSKMRWGTGGEGKRESLQRRPCIHRISYSSPSPLSPSS